MARKSFNLGDYLKAEDVSGLNTEQIVRIPLDRIDPDPNNFYSLQGIEDLAGNIELVGLLDALRVRPRGDRYVIVSGHRRREAIRLITEGGSHMFDAGVPCIVEYGEASDAMRELRLIYANSATRVMSAADLSRQAERVTELLYQLKEQGVEFPGRMRDHVAQACQVSATKIARLHAIRNNLIDTYRLAFDAGKLGETNAYRLSQERQEDQRKIFTKMGLTPCTVSTEVLEKLIDQAKKPKEEPVSREDTAAAQESSFDADDYLRERAEEDDAFFEMLNEEADHFFYRMAALPARHEGIARLKEDFGRDHHSWLHDRVDVMCSPKGVRLWDINGPTDWDVTRTWYDVYDMLCAIALARVAAVTGDDEEGEEEEQEPVSKTDTEPRWMTGMPERNGRYYCRIRFADSPEDGGRTHEQRGEWRDGGWWFFGEPEKYGIQVVGWWPLPDA